VVARIMSLSRAEVVAGILVEEFCMYSDS
jgi:hypothetical protein